MLHLQIGPSALALGLLVPATLAAGFEVAIIGRPGDCGPPEYGRSSSGPTGRLGYLQVKWFEGPEKLDDFPHDLLARLASDEPVLITAALRDHIVARVPLITQALLRRPAVGRHVNPTGALHYSARCGAK